MARSATARCRRAPRPLSAGSWAGLLVAAGVALGLLVSGTTALSWYRHDVRALDSERQSEVDALVDGVRVRLEDIGEFVQGEATAYRGATLPTQNELNDEFALPDVLGREPGVIGEFYVEKVMSGELSGFVARQQAEVSPSFVVLPSGPRDEYWVVARAVPSSLASMIGIDGRSIDVAAQALMLSRDSGKPVASRAVPLSVGKISPDVGARAIPRAIVIVTPVYSTALTPSTVAKRRDEVKGWAGVVVVGDLFARRPATSDRADLGPQPFRRRP